MAEYIQSIVQALVLAGVCAIAAYLLRARKQQIVATVTRLIQEAEEAVQGSGLGEEKKAKVIAQLQAMGITVTDSLSALIDRIVAYLNEKSGWFIREAEDAATKAPESEKD